MKLLWILALIFNLIAMVEWARLGKFGWAGMYVSGAVISVYFLNKGKNNEKENKKTSNKDSKKEQ